MSLCCLRMCVCVFVCKGVSWEVEKNKNKKGLAADAVRPGLKPQLLHEFAHGQALVVLEKAARLLLEEAVCYL